MVGGERNRFPHRRGKMLALGRQPFLVAQWTESMLAGQIAMDRADREGRSDRDVGKPEALQCAPHQIPACLSAGQAFAHVEVQYRATGVAGLQFFLPFQCFEGVIGEADRQLRRQIGRASCRERV